MKLVLVGSVMLLGLVLANGLERGAPEEVQDLCPDGGAGLYLTPDDEHHHFMQEAEVPPNIDFAMLAIRPEDDRHYFILTPPIRLPDLRDRLCDGDWLEEFVPGELEWFEFGP